MKSTLVIQSGPLSLCAATLMFVSTRPLGGPATDERAANRSRWRCVPADRAGRQHGFRADLRREDVERLGRRPTFWRVENGEIVGETTPEKVVKLNNFLIWRGGTVKDFELKVEFRMNGTNSGIQYRSTELPNIGKWVLKGYQADMDFTEGYVGNVHDERGRAPTGEGHVVLSKRGQITRIVDGPDTKWSGPSATARFSEA